MTPTHDGRRVSDLFADALELDAPARAGFLDEIGRKDPSVRRELESLLDAFERARTGDLLPPLLHVDDARPLAAGERIGPYVLRREIGAGGMGVVYEAAREDVEKTVALKLVRHGRLASPEEMRRFLLERRVLARLEHANIARLLDAGVTDGGLPYLVMEHVVGAPIDRWCDERRLRVEERLALFTRVCDAVHYAHRHLVVHRDLKPSNILVTDDGVPKLLDFGIAKLLEEGAAREPRLTRTGHAMLTPEYASPEQMRSEPVTTTSDVYALGVLLYELLSGHSPYRLEARTPAALLHAVCEQQPEPPSKAVARTEGERERSAPEMVSAARGLRAPQLARRLSGDLDRIVLKALDKEPDRRYHAVHELREDIDRHLAGLPVRARGDSLWYRSRKFVRRHRTGVTAVALLGVTLVAGVVATTTQARRAEAERAVAEQRVRDVRALAGALLADVHDAITDLPGSLPARAALVRSAITHLDRLHRQSGDDPALEREIAAAYVKLGLVQGNPTVANLGDLAAARRSFDRALAIAESLVAANPRDDAARRTLALAHEKLGDAIAWSGDVPGALSHARLALAAWGRLAAARPASADARRALAMSRIKLGDLLGNPNLPNVADRASAMAEYRASLDLLRALPADSLQDWTTRRQLALVHERLGAMLSFDGRHTDAIAELEQSLALRRRLALERSASGNALRDLAVANQLLCETQLARGNDEAAFARCREGMELYHSLHAAEPSNVQSVCDLAVGHQSMHKVLAARGELAASLAHLERSTELVRQVLLTHGDNVPARRDLARGLLYASAVHARLAARPHAPRAERAAHREQAAASYADGERMLLALAERGRLTREDEAFLRDIRSRLDGAPAKE